MSDGRILVVEDSPTQGQMAVADLEQDGFEAVLAPSGEEALDCLTAQPFDLVLSDIVMPGIDGYDLCREIKQRYPDLPVVLLTSLTDPLDVVRGLQAGADNFLRKPYDPEQLIARIRTIRYNQELRRAGRATMGLELHFLNQRFMITAERQQILDLLVSTFEDLVAVNEDLRMREAELATARERLQAQLEATELERRRLQSVLAGVPQTLLMVDANGTITDASTSAVSLLATPADELPGRALHDVVRLLRANGEPVEPEARPIAHALAHGEPCELGSTFDLFLGQQDDNRVPIIARAAPVRDGTGAIAGAVEVLTEIGGLLTRDPVTALPTHAIFLDRVERALAMDRNSVAILAVVLDRFNLAREALPPHMSDGLLSEAARRLQIAFEPDTGRPGTDTSSVAYLGYDTFAVLLTGVADEVDAVRVARDLLADLMLSVSCDIDLTVTASVGVAFVSGVASGAQAIADAAATARRASAEGGNRAAAFHPGFDVRAADLLRQESELRGAIDEGQLLVHYQPLLQVGSERVVGVEALVRWQHPQRGVQSPASFIPLAERSGLVVPLGWWVLREACRQVRDWQHRLPAAYELTVSVNLSARQLIGEDPVGMVKAILEETGLPASALVLEITETTVSEDAERAAAALRGLKALGVRVAIDDFGTGYSTLLQLRHFPVDEIKVDKAFVSGMIDDAGDAAIVASSVALGRSLGLEVVAEGVEGAGQLAQLRALGCDVAQGYHWTPPLPAEQFESWLAEHRARPELLHAGSKQVGATADERPRDEILGYIAHEFRNSLAVIRGFGELLVDAEHESEHTVESATHILQAAKQLMGTLDLLADVAVVERGQLKLKVVPTDLASLLRGQLAGLEHLTKDRPVPVTVSAPVVAPVDHTGFGQILRNLISNAAKFSPSGSPIEVDIGEHRGLARISVRDHGPGIPEERRPELFRRFSRLGARERGTGLGLYLSRLIARAHGGDLRFEAPLEGGSRFVVLLPGTPVESPGEP